MLIPVDSAAPPHAADMKLTTPLVYVSEKRVVSTYNRGVI